MTVGFQQFMRSLAVRDNDVVRCTFPTDDSIKGARCILVSQPIKAGLLRSKIKQCWLSGVPLAQLSYCRVEVLA